MDKPSEYVYTVMKSLSSELRTSGYERTEKESPFDEDAQLWTNSFELVCGSTGQVIRKDNSSTLGYSIRENDTDTRKDTNSIETNIIIVAGLV
ncbi:MAG: hypothetical protein J07AB43_01150 [Candidatus Nanosalina sp. J07AB43]|nr:MAG: hypothetical protein J07AB43_01150 [Candidatus Nanosalina sp. J07AB43]